MLCRFWCLVLFVGWTAEWPREVDIVLYSGLWRSPFEVFGPLFVSVPGLNLCPFQLLLVGLAPVCLLSPGAFRRRPWALDAAILISLLSVGLTFLWGFMRGGSAYQSYYQLWRFLAALLVALMLLSVIRDSRDLKRMGVTILAAALVRGVLVIYFYWTYVHDWASRHPKSVLAPTYMTTHDDSLLFVVGFLITATWALVRPKRSVLLAAAVVFPLLIYAMVLNGRRLAWIELLLTLAFAYILLPPGGVTRYVNRALLFAAPVLLLYVAVGWGRQGALFEPLRAFSTSGSIQDASSLARQEEIRNLLYTFTEANPLFGSGWGVPYKEISSIYTHFDKFVQYQYLPHNSLLGMIAFSGLVGLSGIWLVVPIAAFLGTRGYLGSTRAVDRAAAMAAVCFLPAFGVQCYGDIGFQSLTCGLLFAVALATAGKVSSFATPRPSPSPQGHRPAPVGAGPLTSHRT